jgi:hypothetical protein
LGELNASAMMGACEGFTLRNVGLPGIPAGNWPRDALIAACTSRAAALMSRLSANSIMMLVRP